MPWYTYYLHRTTVGPVLNLGTVLGLLLAQGVIYVSTYAYDCTTHLVEVAMSTMQYLQEEHAAMSS